MPSTHYPPTLNDGHHVFVFGSNLAGRHGAGAAWQAKRHWGAVTGVGTGLAGHSYAIPTKDIRLRTLPLAAIKTSVTGFLTYTANFPNLIFLVTRVGCGLAGYSDADIAPLFKGAPANVKLPVEWLDIMEARQA